MAETEQETEVTPAPVPKNGEETMSVNVKGKASDVVRRITGGDKVPQVEVKKGENTDAVIEALKAAKNVFVVKRVEPETFRGIKTRRDVHTGECPATLREIIEFVTKVHGGEKYRISVSDGETNKIIAADRFAVDADPLIPVDPQTADLERVLMSNMNPRKGATQLTSESIEQQTELALKQAEFERAQQTLDDMKKRRTAPAVEGASAIEQRMARMEQLLVEDRQQQRIATLEAELRMAKTQPAAPQSDKTMDLIFRMLEDNKAERAASEARFNQLMAKMQDDKLTALMTEIKSIKDKPAQSGNDLITQVLALKKVGSALGWAVDDDDDDEEEPKEWWEILMKDHLPRLWDVLDGKKNEGKAMSKEEVVAEMNKMADAAAKQAVENQRARGLPAPNVAPVAPVPAPVVAPVIQKIPAPNLAAPAPVPAPTVPAPTIPVVQLPTPSVPVPTVAAPPAPAVADPAVPSPAKAETEMLTVEQEIVMRIVKVMMILDQEMQIRPKDFSWNAIAWDALPEDHADALAAVADPAGIPSVFANVLKPEKIAEMTEKLGNPKVAAFVKRGLDEFKEWHEKLKTDPDFDPFDEGDDDADEPKRGVAL